MKKSVKIHLIRVIRVRFLMEIFIFGAPAKNKPQIKAPRVTPLEGVSTYTLRGIRVCGVENPQGFGIDERRFIAPGLYRRGAGSLPAGLRQWRSAEGRGLGVGDREGGDLP